MSNAVPDWMRGLWRRLSIETEEGQRDTDTQVFYLQTSLCFGDLRIPGNRPDLSRSSFSFLTPAEALLLAQQHGFAGIVQFDQGNPQSRCQWIRQIDYQPPQPVRDIGILYWQDDRLIEEGLDQIYREEWQKVDDGQGDFTALVLADERPDPAVTWQASLVIAGDYFIYSVNRSLPLPSDCSLADCSLADRLTDSAEPEKWQDYLNCEISFGRCRSGVVPWEIQRSTIPWREGSALWSIADLAIDLEHQQVIETVNGTVNCTANCRNTAENQPEIRQWQIWEWGTGQAFQS